MYLYSNLVFELVESIESINQYWILNKMRCSNLYSLHSMIAWPIVFYLFKIDDWKEQTFVSNKKRQNREQMTVVREKKTENTGKNVFSAISTTLLFVETTFELVVCLKKYTVEGNIQTRQIKNTPTKCFWMSFRSFLQIIGWHALFKTPSSFC